MRIPGRKKILQVSSSFSLDVKNPELAKKATESLGNNYVLIELQGYSGEFHNDNLRNNLNKNGNDQISCFL